MKRGAPGSPDSHAMFYSQAAQGGLIPGSGGMAAFALHAPTPSPIPVVIAVPHAGRAYPPALLAALRDPELGPERRQLLGDYRHSLLSV